jgi:hypothetical protein
MATRDEIGTAPLNTIPRGLLDFFGIKSFGQNPVHLQDRIQPTLDLLLWVAQTNAVYLEVPTIVLATANQPGGTVDFPSTQPQNLSVGGRLVVPQNEVWFVHEFVVKAIYNNAADLGEFWPGIYDYPAAINRPQPSDSSLLHNGVAAFVRTAWASMHRPIFVAPGSTLSAYHSGYTSTANSLAVQAIMKLSRLIV